MIDAREAIWRVNAALLSVLRASNPAIPVPIRFGVPQAREDAVSEASISVFLYDLHEDLSLRQGETRAYMAESGALAPPVVHIRFRYLITCWEVGHDLDDPGHYGAHLLGWVLNALLKSRTMPQLPDSYTRIIPPHEQLNSLGVFWQALGNKPRLSLHYEISVPASVSDLASFLPPVVEVQGTARALAESNPPTVKDSSRPSQQETKDA